MSWIENGQVSPSGDTVWACHDRTGRGAHVIADHGDVAIYACPTCHESWAGPGAVAP